jgi:hypothetical protein
MLAISKIMTYFYNGPVLVHSRSEPGPHPLEPELMVQSNIQVEGSNQTQSPVLGSDDIPQEPDQTELYHHYKWSYAMQCDTARSDVSQCPE